MLTQQRGVVSPITLHAYWLSCWLICLMTILNIALVCYFVTQTRWKQIIILKNTGYMTDTNDNKLVCQHSCLLLLLLFYKHNGDVFMWILVWGWPKFGSKHLTMAFIRTDSNTSVPSGRAVWGRGYIEARTDTTQQSGQTPDKEVEIKNITVYVSGYTEGPDSRGR